MRTSIPVCRKPQVSPPPPQNRSTASIPSYRTFLLVAFLAISNKHIQSNTRLPHVQPDGLVRLVNDYLVLPLLHRLIRCSKGPFWIAHSIPFSGGVWEREFSGRGRLGGTPRPTTGSDRSVASPKGRDKRGHSRRSRGDRPTGAFCSAVSSKPPYRLDSG